jgi:predicted transcriptional regulator
MSLKSIINKLKHYFDLKDNHILILEALYNEDLTAEKICDKTKISRGRIYEFLNYLVEYKLVYQEKEPGKASIYTLRHFEDQILMFLVQKIKEEVLAERELLKNIHKKDKINVLVGNRHVAFTFCKLILSGNFLYGLTNNRATSSIFVPKKTEDYYEFNDILKNNKISLFNTRKKIMRLVDGTFKTAVKDGLEVKRVINQQAIDILTKSILEEYGKQKTIDCLKLAKLRSIRYKTAEFKVIKENYPNHLFINDDCVYLMISSDNNVSAVLIQNKEAVQLYSEIFKEIFNRGTPLIDYLDKKLKELDIQSEE